MDPIIWMYCAALSELPVGQHPGDLLAYETSKRADGPREGVTDHARGREHEKTGEHRALAHPRYR